jgi:hypothetical protein
MTSTGVVKRWKIPKSNMGPDWARNQSDKDEED